MPAGLSITNNHDTILIDDTYRNLAVNYKRVLDSSGNVASETGAVVPGMVFARAGLTTWGFSEPVPHTSGVGLWVYDGNGNCTFDSQQQYARVVDQFELTTAGGSVTKTYPAGRAYAVIGGKFGMQARNEIRTDPTQGSPWQNYRRQRRFSQYGVNGNQVTANWSAWSTGGVWSPPVLSSQIPPELTQNPQSTYIVLDVTGY